MKKHLGQPRSSRCASLALSLFVAAALPGAAWAGRCTATTAEAKAERIAAHAFEKHRSEFEARRKIAGKAWPGPSLTTEAALAEKVRQVFDGAAGEHVAGGRLKYWDADTGTIVIFNPWTPDCGTVFRPNRGKAYYDAQR